MMRDREAFKAGERGREGERGEGGMVAEGGYHMCWYGAGVRR